MGNINSAFCCLDHTPSNHNDATATTNSGSSASHGAILTSDTRYDIFLSFRGEDTRHSFTDHLYDALVRAGIKTFRDNDEVDQGQDLNLEIVSAIKASDASIVVLSQNYATSTWCLEELCLILKQRRECSHFVLPVFYKVDPSDVRYQNNGFSIETKASTRWTDDNVKRWKMALTQIANLTGEVVSGSETQLLKKIVDTIYNRLDRKQVYLPPNLIGMDARVKEINCWLNQPDAEFLVICGMGGSGKSTLAQYIVYSNWKSFENISIVECIGSRCREPNGLLYLQKQLLKDILGGKNRRIPSVCQGVFKIEEVLQTKKALILLDDIVKSSQLDALLGSGNINKQSRIIITTMENDIGSWFRSRSRRCREYKMKLLDDHESLELLCLHAFGSKDPMEGYEELAKEVVRYCEGSPLALEVLGSSLSEDISISYWESALKLLGKDIHHDICSVLKKSYDSLPYDSDRELFLHIACFFVGIDMDCVVKILEPDYSAVSRIKTLIKRCLVYVAPNNKLMMHRLLQDMGRNIVDQESPIPSERSRVWRNEESYDMLRNIRNSIKMKGLALDMHVLMEEVDGYKREQIKRSRLWTDSLQEMDQLKLLQLNYVEHVSSYKDFSENLRWLCWHGFNHGNMVSHLSIRNLVTLDMSYCLLTCFQVPIVLKSLKILNLKSSRHLAEIRNISHLPNLETLILWNCHKLAHVCETIKGLTSLGTLNMTGCENLKCCFYFPHSIERLFLQDCKAECTNSFPLSFASQRSLKYLNLGNNLFEHLPSYTHLKYLRVLDLSMCSRLKVLQDLPSTLAELYIYYCESLEKVTFETHRFTLLEVGYEGCSNLSEIEGFIKLVPLAKLDEPDLEHMTWLKRYQDHELCLAGDDELTVGRTCQLQILYEFNIMSTSLLEIRDLNMKPEYLSESTTLSFDVPLCPKDRRLKGLNVTFKYSLSGEEWVWFVKISTTNGVDLVYNPKVFGKPGPSEVAVWLSYFPIGDKLTHGDQVNLSIVVLSGLDIQHCGASLVYSYCESAVDTLQSDKEWIDILGGDFSRFQLSTGAYYLCRRDFFELREIGRLTPGWFSILVGDTVEDTEIRGWRKTGRPQQMCQSYTELKTVRCILYGPQLEDVYRIAEMSTSSFVYKSMEFALSLGGETSKSGSTSDFGDGAMEGLLDQPEVGAGSLRIVESSGRDRTKPDVYISMKDLDNDDFGYYLKEALKREGLRVCPMDREDPEFRLFRTIDHDPKELPAQARASIIVFSESYARSDEHLDELLMILDEMRNSSHFVLPIFYHIESSRVRENGRDLLLQSFQGSEESLRKVDQWNRALIQVSHLPNVYFPGWSRNDDDTAGIKEIVSIVKYVSTRYGIQDTFYEQKGLY
ncbi:hypothetical protein QVD17_27583 [Tagetes erecta]|uniref:TIR domain-containing protein n=1 Tax=Tagetes erecta TaxID=13708 RepID=A0AAD8K9B6_TARER|nr:hypothetical protein QVD17_27583 [Tagetes erecta]